MKISRGHGSNHRRHDPNDERHASAFVPARQTGVMSMEELQVLLNSSDGLNFNGSNKREGAAT